MNRKRLLHVALALSAVAVCVAFFLLTGGGSSESTKTLPDGSVLTLSRISQGTKHRYISGSLFQRAAGRALPEGWAKKLGANFVSYNSSNSTHVIWLERSFPTNLLRGFGSYSIMLRITNDTGFDRSYPLVAQLYGTNRHVHAFVLDASPTDRRDLRITVTQQSAGRLAPVAFDVANPNYVARRKWQARPCPIEAVQDDVCLRLERFNTKAQNPTTARGVAWTELSFVIQDRSVATNNWFARSVRIFNEVGSEFLPPVYPTDAAGARTYATFLGGLSSAEPYNLRFDLRRTSYGPDEQHVFQAVPVPGTNGPPSRQSRAKLQGFTLVSSLRAYGIITADIEPAKSDWRVDLVRVVDDRGRWLPARSRSLTNSMFSWAIAVGPDSSTVDLTFGLTRLRTLEVIARPSFGQ